MEEFDMDCPTCHGNGELEIHRSGEEHGRMEEEALEAAREWVIWPFACPICGGSGYMEQ
jgi:hypothetical protein